MKETNNEFVPPRHWVDLEELSENYWTDPKNQEVRGQEFFEKPIEALAKLDQSPEGGLHRREFLTIMGASMAMASFACVRRPVHKIIPYVVKPEQHTPGVPDWYASTCQECSAGCGILTKNREHRPIKIEGNPDHPINRGTLCARGQASVLSLYDPERLQFPMSGAKSGSTGARIGWEEADRAVTGRLKQAATAGGKVRILSGVTSGPTRSKLIGEFLGGYRAGRWVSFEPLASDDVANGQELAYGRSVVPNFRFDQAEVILSLGADFLGTWGSSLEYASAWAKNRKLDSARASAAKMSKFYCFEPMMTVTGSNADERFGIRAGDELWVALAIAHQIVVVEKRSRFAGDAAVQRVLRAYSPEKVAAMIGGTVTAAKLVEVARDLWAARGKGLVVAGGAQSRTEDSAALQVAVNLLNSALDNEGVTVDGTARAAQVKSSFSDFSRLVSDMNAGNVEVLIVHRANPAYYSPEFAAALKKVPFVVAVNDRVDETAALADYVLPDHHFLENWGDANPRADVFSIQQPAIAPIHETRAFEDSLLAWGQGGTWYDYLRNNWRQTQYSQWGRGRSFDQFWNETLQKGALQSDRVGSPSVRPFRVSALSVVPAEPKNREGFVFSAYESMSMGDGRSANNAWLQEMPDPISTVTWDNYLNVGPAGAARLGIKTHDVVEVTDASGRKLEVPALVQPGLHPDSVALALGYGRMAAGKVGNGVGTNAFEMAAFGSEWALSGQPVSLRRTGKRYELAMTQGHHRTEGRPIVNDITLADFRKNPKAENHTDPHLRMTAVPSLHPPHEYKGYRWGMAVDLNSCIGCGACVIACQAENNIPVVGRARIRMSREMHWIRIDRYYAGSPDQPDVVFQPMMCQHCENASCEKVCPVLATVHSDEGLNEMTYNRCVGTRYCQNNCPYKVRRFNFFDHWKDYKEPMNMVWNPDVTVRQRGVMEKCSFCVQRIEAAKSTAKDRGGKVLEKDLKTACQQTCPTEAIAFGDVNNPETRVSKHRTDARAFRVLEILNNVPMISYLTKVRNKEEGAKHVVHHS